MSYLVSIIVTYLVIAYSNGAASEGQRYVYFLAENSARDIFLTRGGFGEYVGTLTKLLTHIMRYFGAV